MRFSRRAAYGFSILLGRTNINYQAAVGDPTRNSIVVAVVGWLARNFPEAPVRLRRLHPDGTSETIQPGLAGPGWMLRLLERPNPYFSGVLMWMATVTDLFCNGNGYWLKVRDPQYDRVIELWWVPSRYLRPMWPDDGSVFISHYFYRVDGVDYRVENRDVVHFRLGIDPDNPRLGLSKLASLFREIYTDDEAANYSAVILTNMGIPGVVISPSVTGGVTMRTDPETVKTAFMEKFGGDRRGEPLVLTAPTEVKVLSFNPQEMNLKEMRRVPEERVTAVLGISAMVAGLGAGLDRSTFTNYGEARLAAYQESIIPLQRLMAADMEVQLLPDFADTDHDPLDVDFDTSKASAMQALHDAIWKRLESSATKGLITRAAFKEGTGQTVRPEDQVYIVASNYLIIPASATAAPAALPAPTATGGGQSPPPAIPPGDGASALLLPAYASNGHSANGHTPTALILGSSPP